MALFIQRWLACMVLFFAPVSLLAISSDENQLTAQELEVEPLIGGLRHDFRGNQIEVSDEYFKELVHFYWFANIHLQESSKSVDGLDRINSAFTQMMRRLDQSPISEAQKHYVFGLSLLTAPVATIYPQRYASLLEELRPLVEERDEAYRIRVHDRLKSTISANASKLFVPFHLLIYGAAWGGFELGSDLSLVELLSNPPQVVGPYFTVAVAAFALAHRSLWGIQKRREQSYYDERRGKLDRRLDEGRNFFSLELDDVIVACNRVLVL